MPAPTQKQHGMASGFTLLEMMLATAVLALLLTLVFQVIGLTQRATSLVTGQLQAFQEARIGFETLNRKLRQATLNTYWDYDNPANPTRYQRSSELQFLSGPTGTPFFAGLFGNHHPSHALFFAAPLGFIRSDTTGDSKIF